MGFFCGFSVEGHSWYEALDYFPMNLTNEFCKVLVMIVVLRYLYIWSTIKFDGQFSFLMQDMKIFRCFLLILMCIEIINFSLSLFTFLTNFYAPSNRFCRDASESGFVTYIGAEYLEYLTDSLNFMCWC